MLAAFALLFMLSSAFFPVMLCHHDCTGEHCPFCLQIRTWDAVRRLLGGCILCVFFALLAAFCAHAFRAMGSCPLYHITPVLLKTKLLN